MMNSPRANNSNSNKSSNEIERKLQRVEADFRRQREEARRAAELAAERLRLAQEDAASRRKTVDDLQVKLQHVHVDKDSRTKFYELTVSVEMSTKEAHFQHAEFVQKREKVGAYQRDLVRARAKRSATLRSLQDVLRCQRSRHASQLCTGFDVLCGSTSRQYLEQELRDDRDGRLTHKWPRLIHEQTKKIKKSNSELEQVTIPRLQRAIEAYQRQFVGPSAVVDTQMENNIMEVSLSQNEMPPPFPKSSM